MSTVTGATARQFPQSGVDDADPPSSRLRVANRSRSGAALIALLTSLAAMSGPTLAAVGPETFGPGKVACEHLGAGQYDCLLTSLMVGQNGSDVATFSLATLPTTERAIFQKWCSTAADDCTVQIQGTRQVPGGSLLSSVTSVSWTRLSAPMNQEAARASED